MYDELQIIMSKDRMEREELLKKFARKLGCSTLELYSSNGVMNESELIRRIENRIKTISTTDPDWFRIRMLIKKEEGFNLERKSTLRWDLNKGIRNDDLALNVLKAIGGFLNMTGGTVLIGIDDDGEIVGLNYDYQLFKKKKNYDQFQQHLTELIIKHLDKLVFKFLKIKVHNIDEEEICEVKIEPSDKPAYLNWKDEVFFYIRTANSTRLLVENEIQEFIEKRWPQKSAYNQDHYVHEGVAYWQAHGQMKTYLDSLSLNDKQKKDVYIAAKKRHKPNSVIDERKIIKYLNLNL